MQDIYELSQEYNTLKATLSEMLEGGHIDEDCLQNTLLELKGDLEDKAINIAKMIKNKEAYIEGLDHRASEIKERLKQLTNRIKKAEEYNEYLKNILKRAMDDLNADSIDTPDFLVREKKKRPKVHLKVDVSDLPQQYIVTKEESKADLNLIYDHICKGVDLSKFAELGDNTRLEII